MGSLVRRGVCTAEKNGGTGRGGRGRAFMFKKHARVFRRAAVCRPPVIQLREQVGTGRARWARPGMPGPAHTKGYRDSGKS